MWRSGVKTNSQEYFGKRAIDITLALAAILASFPMLIAICLLIWQRDGGPALYRHTRIGRNGRPFQCLKFRTMAKDSEAVLADLLSRDAKALDEWNRSQKLRHDPRILPGIGSFLRKTSLDELPQLFNVLRGDMSLVGPRPVTRTELVHYGDLVGHYLALRPGLTGAWQVSGRSDTTFAERVRLDVSYASDNSVLRDLRILADTVPVVVMRRGAYGIASMLLMHHAGATEALFACGPCWT